MQRKHKQPFFLHSRVSFDLNNKDCLYLSYDAFYIHHSWNFPHKEITEYHHGDFFSLSLFTPTDSILPLTDATSLFSGETEFSSINRGDFSAIETHGWSVTAGCCGGKKMTWMNTGFKIVSATLQHPRLKNSTSDEDQGVFYVVLTKCKVILLMFIIF